MAEVSSIKSTPGVFPFVDSLSDLGVTGSHVKAKLAGGRNGVLMEIREASRELLRTCRLFKNQSRDVTAKGGRNRLVMNDKQMFRL